MEAPDIGALLESAAPRPGRAPDVGAIEDRARRRRRRRSSALAGASLVGLVLVVGLVALVPGPRERRTVVAGPLSSRPIPLELREDGATVDVTLLDGTRLRVRLPERVGRSLAGATFDDLELHGSVYGDSGTGRGWRIDVTVDSVERLVAYGNPLPVPPTSEASAVRVDRAGRRLGLQFGEWTALVSGDSLTEPEIKSLLAGVDFAQTHDGFVKYRGSLPLWLIDSPDAHLSGKDVRASLFMGECSHPTAPDPRSSTPVRWNAAGLVFWHFDDPARGRRVTGLCDAVNKIEIWLDAPGPLNDDEIDRAAVEVLTVGSTLEAVQRGQHP